MRQYSLSNIKHGIDRQRTKGGASPQAFYDLVNARLDTSGGIGPRHGLDLHADLSAGTVGLYAFKGLLHVFASSNVAVPSGYKLVILRHPTAAIALAKVHYVHPLLGRLYVVAEFANGDVVDYWVQEPPAWAPSTIYSFGKQVRATVDSGLVFQITNTFALPTWTKDTEYALNAEVVPTVANGFKYKAVAVNGSPVRSSSTEPTWPTVEAGTVTEYRSG
jgi:hypothetical protein